MLKAYFDESGKFHNPEETASAIGGCIASAEAWTHLEMEWDLVLREFHVKELHMKDLSFFRGEYEGWDTTKREQFLGRLLPIMKRYVYRNFAAMVPVEHYKMMSDAHANIVKDPYYLCIFDVICSAWRIAWTDHEPHEYVEIVCDENPEVETRAKEVYRNIKANLDHGELLASFGFGESHLIIPLQCADLVAYECLQWQRRHLKEDTRTPRWPMQQLLTNCDFKSFSPEEIMQMGEIHGDRRSNEA